MAGENYLAQAFVYLTAAVVSVPIAKRLGLGSVLGYLLAGAAIGPSALRLVDGGGGGIMHYAEFGVVMMLFLIGLELHPARLWELRGPVFGLGGSQVLGTALVILLVATIGGLPWREGVALGLILALSSTAIVLQSLGERKWLKTPGGEASFSVLLFQDLAVIPILAALPLLAMPGSNPAPAPGGKLPWIESLPGWAHALAVLGAVAGVIATGRYALTPFFRYIARTDLREVFTATALGLVIGIALLMQAVGLSAALGTFLAGVVLADSEYRQQLEADIEPFKGLLLGLFFISVGASIDFGYFVREPATIFGLVAGLLAIKFAVLLGVSRLFRMAPLDGSLFAFALSQGGEFIFVLLAFAVAQRTLPPAVADPLVAAVALTMAATPLLLALYGKMVRPRLVPHTHHHDEREPDAIEEHDTQVILAGFGRFGHVVGRFLTANGVRSVVLERDADWIETMREFGLKSYYGDATRVDLLHSAGAATAKLFVVALDDQASSLRLVETLQQHFPQLVIFARAVDRLHAYELMRRGLPFERVYRETFGSSLEMGVDALEALGFEPAQVERSAQIFRQHDENGMRALAPLFDGDRQVYASTARQHIQNLENLLRADRQA